MKPRLIGVSGKLNGWIFYLDDSVVTIGRQLSNMICLSEDEVSRQHCLIRYENRRHKIIDLDTTNGTYVNGKRVKECLLENGSLIQIGNVIFVFWSQELSALVQSFKTGIVSSDSGH